MPKVSKIDSATRQNLRQAETTKAIVTELAEDLAIPDSVLKLQLVETAEEHLGIKLNAFKQYLAGQVTDPVYVYEKEYVPLAKTPEKVTPEESTVDMPKKHENASSFYVEPLGTKPEARVAEAEVKEKPTEAAKSNVTLLRQPASLPVVEDVSKPSTAKSSAYNTIAYYAAKYGVDEIDLNIQLEENDFQYLCEKRLWVPTEIGEPHTVQVGQELEWDARFIHKFMEEDYED